MSLSTAIQGLLVAQVPEYEISNEAIGYLSDFSGKVLNKHESSAINNAGISFGEVKTAINKIFPQAWASLIFREVSNQVLHQQHDDKESMLKNEISDFEMIDDGHQSSPKVEHKNLGNLFLSADFIKSYLPAPDSSKIDTHVSLESVLSKLIQQSRVVLEHHEDPMAITKEAIEQAINQDASLSDLSNALSIEQPAEDDTADFEVVEEEKDEKQKEPASDVEENEVTTESAEKSEIFSDEEVMPEEPTPISETSTSPIVTEERAPTPPSFVDSPAPAEDVLAESTSQESIAEPEQTTETPNESESDVLSEPTPEPKALATVDFSSAKLIKAKKPVSELYGRCCPYFDATTFAIQMLSSIMELFLLHLVTETCNIARPQKRIMKHHVREALARLTSPQALPQNELPQTDSSIFNECVNNSIITISNRTKWETDVKTYVSDAVMYISTKVLLVAASHARTTSDWVINSNCIALAASQLVPVAPITQLIKMLQSTLVGEGEGPIITPPPAPRIRAAEMIYLTSLFKETPLQLDNQLLVVFMFLVSLSLHTLCCVK